MALRDGAYSPSRVASRRSSSGAGIRPASDNRYTCRQEQLSSPATAYTLSSSACSAGRGSGAALTLPPALASWLIDFPLRMPRKPLAHVCETASFSILLAVDADFLHACCRRCLQLPIATEIGLRTTKKRILRNPLLCVDFVRFALDGLQLSGWPRYRRWHVRGCARTRSWSSCFSRFRHGTHSFPAFCEFRSASHLMHRRGPESRTSAP